MVSVEITPEYGYVLLSSVSFLSVTPAISAQEASLGGSIIYPFFSLCLISMHKSSITCALASPKQTSANIRLSYVLIAATSTFFLNIVHTFNTGKYRKAAKVDYPAAYAPSSRTDAEAVRFNVRTLEEHPIPHSFWALRYTCSSRIPS